MYNKFLNFWIKNIKISILLIFFLIFYGIYNIINIKKEASPKIKLGQITITTIWNGVNPTDIDRLVTEKIEKKISTINEIEEIKSISITSSSIIKILLKKDADSTKIMTKLQNSLSNIKLPNGTEKPKIKEIISDNNFIFELIVYGNKKKLSDFKIREKAKLLKTILENNSNIGKVQIGGYRNIAGGKFLDENDYQIKILLDKNKIEKLGLSIHIIAKTIKDFNKNINLGKHFIEGKGYNYLIGGKFDNINNLLKLQINTLEGSILLSDIAKIKKEYPIYRKRSFGIPNDNNKYNYISLLISKNDNLQITKAAQNIKKQLEYIFQEPEFKYLNYTYSKDLSYLIKKDFLSLYKTILVTIILVFFTLLIFVGFKESIISIILLPLSFLLTFVLLNSLGLSLNMMTNFSLIISFGIMIDTIIVIIEGISENLKKGFYGKENIFRTFNEYGSSLISGNITTLVAIFPMMFFPGIIGKYVSYIPITIFLAIISTIIITFTISIALFLSFKNSKKIENDSYYLKYLRQKRIIFLNFLSKTYIKILKKILSSNKLIYSWIFIPIFLLILSFIILSPKIGFTMFPDSDKSIITIDINTKKNLSKEYLEQKYIEKINKVLNKKSEILFYYTTISNNNIYSYLELKDKDIRDKEIKETVNEIFEKLKNIGKNELNISVKAEKEGPNNSKNIGIKFIANTPNDFVKLEEVANDFKRFLEKEKGLKNISISTKGDSGTFKFNFNREKLKQIGLTQNDITREIYFYINGLNAGNIKSNIENNSIVIFLNGFNKKLNPQKIENLVITTKVGKIRVGDFLTYSLINSVSKITRDNGKISISVNADLKDISEINTIRNKIFNYAETYKYPKGVSIKQSGEIEKNKKIIDYIIKSFSISIFIIFLLLVYQFKSYSQSLLISYSIIITLLSINIGLFLFGKPYSMPFLIGFIALAGIVVNDSIILIETLNNKLKQEKIYNSEEYSQKIIQISNTRLYPIIITTLTTILGIFPLFFQGNFWITFSITVTFGLFLGSLMTLIIIPIIYKRYYKKRFLTK